LSSECPKTLCIIARDHDGPPREYRCRVLNLDEATGLLSESLSFPLPFPGRVTDWLKVIAVSMSQVFVQEGGRENEGVFLVGVSAYFTHGGARTIHTISGPSTMVVRGHFYQSQ